MSDDTHDRIARLQKRIPDLTAGQLYWLDRVVNVFGSEHRFEYLREDLFDRSILEDFGDTLRIHHCFSAEPFSKDKFEYVLERVVKMSGNRASLAPKGNRGHDITIEGCRISLKTQANRAIKVDHIWISKVMELGKGDWGNDPADLKGLRDGFLEHLKGYNRILVLRALERSPQWHYELVEIPMELLLRAKEGELEMKLDSTQFPKPGYCHIRDDNKSLMYQLYFDGGSERKLQLKGLRKSLCKVHADWQFVIPDERG